MFLMAVLGLIFHCVMLVVSSAREHLITAEDGSKFNAAYVHVLGDLIQTGAVLIAAVLLWWQPFDIGHFPCDKTVKQVSLALGLAWDQSDKGSACANWQYVDPICTCFCGLVSVMTTAHILKESVDVAMGRAADVK